MGFTTSGVIFLFESCASGGARFDPGMLFYAPQCWTSDDTDAVERLSIQYGTSMVYPISSMGAHVSAVPNHQLNRVTPLATRAAVALFGTFGYELDLNRLPAAEKKRFRNRLPLPRPGDRSFSSAPSGGSKVPLTGGTLHGWRLHRMAALPWWGSIGCCSR